VTRHRDVWQVSRYHGRASKGKIVIINAYHQKRRWQKRNQNNQTRKIKRKRKSISSIDNLDRHQHSAHRRIKLNQQIASKGNQIDVKRRQAISERGVRDKTAA